MLDQPLDSPDEQPSSWHSYADLFAAVILILVLVFLIALARNFLDAMELNQVREKLKTLDEFSQRFTDFFQSFEGKDIIDIQDDGRIRFRDSVLFGESHWGIQPEYYPVVLSFREHLHGFLVSYADEDSGASADDPAPCNLQYRCTGLPDDEVQIIVAGHADSTRIIYTRQMWLSDRGLQTSLARLRANWDLSSLRAATVVRALTNSGEFCYIDEFKEASGTVIDPCKYNIRAAGFGEYQPLDSTQKQKNRRIEVEVRLNIEKQLANLGLIRGRR